MYNFNRKVLLSQCKLFKMKSGNSTLFSFFRIVLSKTLSLPKKFAYRYGQSLSNPVCLVLGNGDEWKVHWERRDGVVCFDENGWEKLSHHYAISIGHFLVFDYQGNSRFVVYVYDKSTAEIDQYPPKYGPNSDNGDSDSDSDIDSDSDSDSNSNSDSDSDSDSEVEFLSELSVAPKERKSQVSGHLQPRKRGRPRTVIVKEKSKALLRANAFRSENPFFKLVMKASYVNLRASHIYIPQRFSRKFLKGRDGDTILQTNNGRKWRMSCKTCNGHLIRKMLCAGWKSFARDNDLQIGDACVFELMRKSKYMLFKVVIFRFKGETGCPPKHDKKVKIDRTLNSATVVEEHGLSSSHGFTKLHNRLKFRIGMCRTYVMRPTNLHVPRRIAKRCFTAKHGFVSLKLKYGRLSWSVEYKIKRVGKCQVTEFCSGWNQFLRDNNLGLGDVCIFELLDIKKLLFEVQIDRAA